MMAVSLQVMKQDLEAKLKELGVVNTHFIHLQDNLQGYRPFNTDLFDSLSVGVFELADNKFVTTGHAIAKDSGYTFDKDANEVIISELFIEGSVVDLTPVIEKMNGEVSLESKLKAFVNHIIATATFSFKRLAIPKREKTKGKQFKHYLNDLSEEQLVQEFKDFIIANAKIKTESGESRTLVPDDIQIKFHHIKQYANNTFAGMFGTKDYIKNVAETHAEDNISHMSNGGFTVGIVTVKDTDIVFLISSLCLKTDQYNSSLGRKTALNSFKHKPQTMYALDVSKWQGTSLTDDLISHILASNYQHVFNAYIPQNTEQKIFA